MKNEQKLEKLKELAVVETEENESNHFWLSFATEEKNIGVVITEAYGPASSYLNALKVLPEGAIDAFCEIVLMNESSVKEGSTDRVLGKEELIGYDYIEDEVLH